MLFIYAHLSNDTFYPICNTHKIKYEYDKAENLLQIGNRVKIKKKYAWKRENA